MNTQPPAAPRPSKGTTVTFLALAGATVLAAGAGGYVAQSYRQTEIPTVEARAASPAPASPAPASQAPASAPTAAAPTSAAQSAPEPEPARQASAAAEAAPTRPPTVDASPAPSRPREPEPVEREVVRRSPVSAPAARSARVQSQVPAAPAAQPSTPPRTPDPAPAVEAPAPDAGPVAEAAPEPVVEPVQKPAATRVSITETFTIPADSVVGLEIETSVSSQTAQVEDRVDARVTRDVKIDGTTVIPAGSRVRGEVIRVEHGGKFKERGRLGIAFHTLVLPDGESIDIETDPVFREGDDVGRKASTRIGATAAGGAIIGAIFGGEKGAAIGAAAGAGAGTAVTAAQKASEARFRAGSVVTVRLIAPVSITLQQ